MFCRSRIPRLVLASQSAHVLMTDGGCAMADDANEAVEDSQSVSQITGC